MEFGSVVFLLRFLPMFFILYYLVPGRARNVVLLLGSLCFYAWGEPICLLPMAFSVISDFIHARQIEKHRGKGTAKILLASAIFLDLSLLFFFGYADFFIETANILFHVGWPKLGYPLPVGITVYTLQTMSYVIDVYRGKIPAGRNLLEYATYVTMFPQLKVGPVVRFQDLQPNLKSGKVSLHQVSTGAKRICVGLAKKVLIADTCGQLWNMVMENPMQNISVATAWLGIVAFAFRIYFSFAGYADIAIGLGTCLGYTLPESFDHPYAATSVTDFLYRWNVTIGKWMKEYFYDSVIRGKKGTLRRIFWVMITWGLIGFWYGPDWTFVLWGLWLALFFILEKLFLGKLLEHLPRLIGWAYAMLVVAFGWLLFALDDVSDAWTYLQSALCLSKNAIYDNQFLFLLFEFLPVLALGAFFALPIARSFMDQLEKGKNGPSIALRRLVEKIYPAVFLLLSLVYLIGRKW
ncbi:MAG: MBOAT family protein [Acetatifactor sp.]|nr:MBOAT family protein [Acetatifactor sp.]